VILPARCFPERDWCMHVLLAGTVRHGRWPVKAGLRRAEKAASPS
jgi:hypothetical protein